MPENNPRHASCRGLEEDVLLQPLHRGLVSLYYFDRSERPLSSKWLEILDPEELGVYQRYLVQAKKEEFLAGRVLLKTILAHYTARQPREIRFAKTDYGKLELPEEFQGGLEAPIKFNLSHSGQMVVAGVTLADEIGVDVEQIRGESALEKIAARFFAPGEIGSLAQSPPAIRQEMAYQIWTRKEAYIKAKGEGLSMGLDSFDITIPDPSLFCHFQILEPSYALAVVVIRQPELDYRLTLHNFADLVLWGNSLSFFLKP